RMGGDLVGELGEQRGAVAAAVFELIFDLFDQLLDLGVLRFEQFEYVDGVLHTAASCTADASEQAGDIPRRTSCEFARLHAAVKTAAHETRGRRPGGRRRRRTVQLDAAATPLLRVVTTNG